MARKKGGLPRGVKKTQSGRFAATAQYSSANMIQGYIGVFDTPEQASAAYTLVRGELDKNRSLSAKEFDVVFKDAKLEEAGEGVARKKRGLPRGVNQTFSGRFVASAQYSGVKNPGGYIGVFDTPEQASAAYTLVRDELDKNRFLNADKLDVVFEAAKARALEKFQAGPEKTVKSRSKEPASSLHLLPRLLVGSRISIYWELDEEYYPGTITALVDDTATIKYDDEYTEVLDLSKEQFKMQNGLELDPCATEALKVDTAKISSDGNRRPGNLNDDEISWLAGGIQLLPPDKHSLGGDKSLPRGVQKTSSGRFIAIARNKSTANASGYIGSFATSEHASAA